MEDVILTHVQLAKRWQVAEASLERWRSDGVGPIYLKIQGIVRYRLKDIEDFEIKSIPERFLAKVGRRAA